MRDAGAAGDREAPMSINIFGSFSAIRLRIHAATPR
jgi:hypothetical protein